MRKLTRLSVLSVLFGFLFFGCSHNNNEGSRPAFDGGLRVTYYNITQHKIWFEEEGKTIEGTQLILRWTISKAFTNVHVKIEESNYGRDISSGYSGLRLNVKYRESPLLIKVTPFNNDVAGVTQEISYMPSPDLNEPDYFPGTDLAAGTEDVDCNMEAGDYKIIELNNSRLNLTNAKNTSVYVARINTQPETLYSNRFALPYSSSIKPVANRREDLSELSENNVKNEEKELYFDVMDVVIGAEENSDDGKIAEKYDLIEIQTENGTEIIKRIHPDIKIDESSIRFPSQNARAVAAPEDNSPVDYKIGDKKDFSISEAEDVDHNQSLKPAILQYKSDNCYVWVIEDYFSEEENASGPKVNGKICKKIGITLDEVIKLERNIFGQEWEYLITGNGNVPMNENSRTDIKVNILLYDIQSDFVEGNSTGIYGFFTNGDYYIEGTVYNTSSASNGGKYLHVDSGFASDEKLFPSVLSTVVHEFQHLIHYGQKRGYEKKTDVFFNEMCSMLAEDMFQTKLNLEDMDSAKYRFVHFLYSWQYLPFFVWNQGTLYAYSYSNAFGLGSFVAKKYGGADFVYDFMHTQSNPYGNLDSFMEAVHLHEPSATKDSMLRDLAVELCIGKVYKTEVVSEKHVMDDYDYPMTGFDIKNLMGFVEDAAGTNYTLLDGHVEEFKPDRIDVSLVEKIKAEEETIEFFGKSAETIKEYIVLVKEQE